MKDTGAFGGRDAGSIPLDVPRTSTVILDLDVGPGFLHEFLNLPDGVAAWNAWVAAAFDSGLILPSGGALGGRDPLVMLGLDFGGGDFRLLCLDGIDLSSAWLGRADFTDSSLRGAQIGCCPRAVFRQADLTGAVISGDISGTDFTDARFDGVDLRDSSYMRGSPPLGLPPGVLSQCREEPDEPTEAAGRLQERPVACRARLIITPVRSGSTGNSWGLPW